MESEGSLPSSQQPANSPHPEPDESGLQLPNYSFKIHFSIILSTAPKSPKWSPPLEFPE